SPSTAPTRACPSSCGCAWRLARSSWTSIASTWAPRCRTPGRKSRCTAGAAAGDVAVAGRAAAGGVHHGPPRGHAGRVAAPRPAGAQQHGPPDREVLILRHFEELSNAETAQVLGIKPSAAVNRYVRALRRLKDVFQGMPGGIEGI